MLRLLCSISFILILKISWSQDGSLIANTKTAGQHVTVSQAFTGLWEVMEVSVGTEILTPTAKWFQLNQDKTGTSGNGWVQNSESTWEFDEVSKQILFSHNGRPDEYGSFLLEHYEKEMTWSRMEEGQKVVVKLSKVEKKPLAPWDKIVSIWKLAKTEGLDPETAVVKSIYDMNPSWYRIRWDRYFVKHDVTGKRTQFGIWHIDPHRPVLSLIDNTSNQRENWTIEFKNDQMVWTREMNGELMQLTFLKDVKVGN